MSRVEDGPEDPVRFRSYTHARRFPLVIGNIQGLRLRVPWTPAQLTIAVGSFLVLLTTQSIWGHLGWLVNSMLLIGVPIGLAFAARATRMEGRSPWRFAVGTMIGASRRWSRHDVPIRRSYRGRVPVSSED